MRKLINSLVFVALTLVSTNNFAYSPEPKELVAELVAAGELTWDEAEKHPQSNAITRAVGVGEDLELDKVRGETEVGDRYLLCSDGLTKYATFDILLKAMTGTPIETVSEKLLSIALDGGGADNISIIVVDIQ